jgi:hypothetical protein
MKINPAVGLYERLGFRITSEDEYKYYMRTGDQQNAEGGPIRRSIIAKLTNETLSPQRGHSMVSSAHERLHVASCAGLLGFELLLILLVLGRLLNVARDMLEQLKSLDHSRGDSEVFQKP